MKNILDMNKDELNDFVRTALDAVIHKNSVIFLNWLPDYQYRTGDRIIWHDFRFTCIKDHTSGKEFERKYWGL